MDTKAFLDIAIKAAITAGQEIMVIYKTDFEITQKSDHSPLTTADKAANKVIMSHLSATNIPVISEENKQIPYSERKDWETFWLVDPLDGTKEFIKKNGEFTVNIALVHKGAPIIGVIYVPEKQTLYYGDSNGAYKTEQVATYNDFLQHEAIRLQPKVAGEDVVVVASRSHMTSETEQFIQKIQDNTGIRQVTTLSAGSSLKLCLVAEGKADVYPRYAPTMEWDVAAGHGICRAAGVPVVQANTTQPLKYNKEELLNPWFVVGHTF